MVRGCVWNGRVERCVELCVGLVRGTAGKYIVWTVSVLVSLLLAALRTVPQGGLGERFAGNARDFVRETSLKHSLNGLAE